MVIEKDGLIYEECYNTLKLIGLKRRIVDDLTIPEHVNGKRVTIIASDVFRGMTGIKMVGIPDCVEAIGSRAFSHCQNLTRIILYKTNYPAKVLEINENAFLHCVQLQYFSSHVPLFLYRHAFANCKIFENLNATVVFCGDEVFQNCSSLKQIAFDDNIVWTQYSFNKCPNLQIMIFNGALGKSLLRDMPALASVKAKSWICKSNFSNLDLVNLGFKIKII